MTMKYCPHCKKIGNTRVLAHYKQVPWNGIPVKQRRVIHLVEDGGCGRTWYTGELPFKMLVNSSVKAAKANYGNGELDEDHET